jgi:beta-lactamase class A
MCRRPLLPKRHRFAAIFAAMLVVTTLAVACGGDSQSPTSTPIAPAPTTNSIPPASAVASPSPATAQASISVAASVDRLLQDEDGVYGVVLMKPDGTVIYSHNANTPFIAASLYKLILMAEIYQQREDGELAMDQTILISDEFFPPEEEGIDTYFDLSFIGTEVTVEEALFAAGAYSSNVAARALLTLTNQASLERAAHDLGLVDTHLFVNPETMDEWPPTPSPDTSDAQTEEAIQFVTSSAVDGPVNLTTPHDMSLFFSKLIAGKIVNGHVSREILDTLGQQMVDDRFPTLLPAGTRLVHKTGNLDHVVHDVGIIYCPNGPIILAAMAEGTSDDDDATEVIQRLAMIAYGANEAPIVAASPVGGMTEPGPESKATPSAVTVPSPAP